MKRWVLLAMALTVVSVPYIYAQSVMTEYQITTDTGTQWRPSVYGNIVVWQDQRNGNADIYGYDMFTSTEFPICTNTFNQEHPTIWEDIVVWYDWRNGNADIYGYDLSTSTEFPICLNTNNQRLPVIWENFVVYNDWRNGNWDVYGYNLSTSTEFPICTNGAHQYFPRTGGRYAVWWDERNGIGNWDIYGYDLLTNTEFPICLDPNNQGYPHVHDDIVAWIDDRDGNWSIYGYNIATATEFPICTNTSDQFRPWVSNDVVTWFDLRNGNQDIYGYEISTATEFQITTNASDQRHPKIHCNRVLWHDRRDGDYNIYGADLDINSCACVVADPDVARVRWFMGLMGTATYDVTVNFPYCFTRAVKLSVTGLPPGTRRYYFYPNHVIPTPAGGSATVRLAVEVTRGTPVGDYVLTIVGDDGSNTHTYDVTMQVRRPPIIRGPMVTKEGVVPEEYVLVQNYPNPFNPETSIEFGLPETGDVTVTVYNTLGQEVAVLVDEELDGGFYTVSWDAAGLPTGVYFYRIVAGTFNETRRMVYMK